MTDIECLIRSIAGGIRPNMAPLICTAEIVGDLFFARHIPLEDIRAKQVYPLVSQRMGLSLCAASRRIQRLAHICWDCMREKDLILPYIGRMLGRCPDACRLAGYLAFYVCLRIPYFEAIARDPSLLFTPHMNFPQGASRECSDRRPPCGQPFSGSRALHFGRDAAPICPICPNCGQTLEPEYQNYCSRCGRQFDWFDVSGALPNL